MLPEHEINFSMKCIKLMLFVANFMFVLVGFLLLSIGLTIKVIYTEFDHFLVDHYYDASKLAIAVGIIIFLVSIFGCVGAIKQSVFLINIYTLCLFLVLILEITVSIVASTMRYDLGRTIRAEMTDSMQYYDQGSGFIWNLTQYNLGCCGVRGPDDWYDYGTQFNLIEVPRKLIEGRSSDSGDNAATTNDPDVEIVFRVPATCCLNETCADQNSVYLDGCLIGITYIINECALLLGVGALCVAFIQILGIIFANLLAKAVRKLKTQREVARTERRLHIYEQLANAAQASQKVSPVLYTPTSSEA